MHRKSTEEGILLTNVWHFTGRLLLRHISILHAADSLHPWGDSTWSKRWNSLLYHP